MRRGRSAHETVFTEIWSQQAWQEGESLSGPGSELSRTAGLRAELERLVRELGARRLLDAGCGDFLWMKEVDLGRCRYVGVDVVPAIVDANRAAFGSRRRRFLRRDITRDRLPRADLVLCRECLLHFDDTDVWRALRNLLRRRPSWLLLGTFPGQGNNPPIATGHWRPLDLQAPPFSLPPPTWACPDAPPGDAQAGAAKQLGLWKGSDLATAVGQAAPPVH